MINSKEMEKLLKEQSLDENFAVVYEKDAYATQYARFLEVLAAFRELFDMDGDREVSLFSAPGRSEIGGNHTDHNHGLVLAAGISLDAIAVASNATFNGVAIVSGNGTANSQDEVWVSMLADTTQFPEPRPSIGFDTRVSLRSGSGTAVC